MADIEIFGKLVNKTNGVLAGGNQVSVNVGDEATDLQSAIDDGKIGGGAKNWVDGDGEGAVKMGDVVVEGETYSNTASGIGSSAEGVNNTASGWASHAEGESTIACNSDSHAEGYGTSASGDSSHAEGYGTSASYMASHAEGEYTTASGEASHAEGLGTSTKRNTASGTASHAEGNQTLASGNESHAEGKSTTASGTTSHAEGFNANATGNASHAEGEYTTASGSYSHSEGYYTTASGDDSHAEGKNSCASGEASHVEGDGNTASGYASHAEGNGSIAKGDYSHIEGKSKNGGAEIGVIIRPDSNYTFISGAEITINTQGGYCRINKNKSEIYGLYVNELTITGWTLSDIEGYDNYKNIDTIKLKNNTDSTINLFSSTQYYIKQPHIAYGEASHSEGCNCRAKGDYSHAEGDGTIALNGYEHAEGFYNESHTEVDKMYPSKSKCTLHSVGYGELGLRKNAHEIMRNGDHYFAKGKLFYGHFGDEDAYDLVPRTYNRSNTLSEFYNDEKGYYQIYIKSNSGTRTFDFRCLRDTEDLCIELNVEDVCQNETVIYYPADTMVLVETTYIIRMNEENEDDELDSVISLQNGVAVFGAIPIHLDEEEEEETTTEA